MMHSYFIPVVYKCIVYGFYFSVGTVTTCLERTLITFTMITRVLCGWFFNVADCIKKEGLARWWRHNFVHHTANNTNKNFLGGAMFCDGGGCYKTIVFIKTLLSWYFQFPKQCIKSLDAVVPVQRQFNHIPIVKGRYSIGNVGKTTCMQTLCAII